MTKQSGFSLLELSIVLVIIGLIAGGIVAGASMIRAAELRAVITEINKFQTSVHTFRDKYLGIPGDLKNATAFWGAAHTTPATCVSTAGTGTETCNGNGDGRIDRGPGPSNYSESFMFWQHLANADLLEGTYTGITGPGSNGDAIIGNIYESKLSGAVFHTLNVNQAYSGHAEFFDGTYDKNYWHLAGIDPSDPGSPSVPMLTPEEIWNIDKKIDDGKPATGSVIERHWDDCTNASASSDLTADYLLSEAGKVCIPIFYGLF